MKLSSLIKKPLLVLYGSMNFEITNNFVIDGRFSKIKYLIVKTKEKKFFLRPKSIFTIGKDAIIIKKEEQLTDETIFKLCNTNYIISIENDIFTNRGNFIAKLEDIEIDENFFITKVQLSKDYDNQLKITSSGKNIIIAKDYKPKQIKIKEEMKQMPVETMPIQRKTSDTKFLVGRIVLSDIKGVNGEIIIRKNTIITDKIIKKAKNNFKVQELIIKSKEFNIS